MSDRQQATCIVAIMLTLGAWSYFCYRAHYNHNHRLRVVETGKLYRSGQLTVEGFTNAVRDLKIRTILNVQDDYPDPQVYHSYLDRRTTPESQVCKQLGVNYIWLPPDLVNLTAPKDQVPEAIAKYLAILDDPANYPILLHCKAGLHRTGLLSAIYRMEYQGWSRDLAHREMKWHGFGDWASTRANPYIEQYLERFHRRIKSTTVAQQD